MGILSKKEVKRPMQEVGKNGAIIWYPDNNQTIIRKGWITPFINSYKENVSPKDLGALDNTDCEIHTNLLIHEIISTKAPDLFEYFLVYFELPEMVEDLLISQYKEKKKQIALIQDKINQKRKKLL